MDPLVLGILLSITFSAFQGVTPQCCIETVRRFPLKLLAKVDKYHVQTSRGACDINALVLHVGHKKYCADPKQKKILRRLRNKNRRKNTPVV
ncbi:C-C motif chemokine 27b [Triplophysa dalaica]|uniref:C-C motif chemokine 27b n=1 Tax=Triplophysa dalaica TaxID=1582913 RepID=UPI0024DFF314|nr:C-C motif chemokine 27b [Triplophysa dalaica]